MFLRRTTCHHEVDRLCRAQSALCSVSTIEPTYTAATYESTAVHHLQADQPSWSSMNHHRCGQRSLHTRRNSCARIRRHISLRSLVPTWSCRGHTCWTSYRCCERSRMHRSRRYPSTKPLPACSCMPRSVLGTYCTRRGTSCWCSCVTASRTSTYSGRSLSADWAVRCRASSCRLGCQNRL